MFYLTLNDPIISPDHENMGLDTNYITIGVEIKIIWVFTFFEIMAAQKGPKIEFYDTAIHYRYKTILEMNSTPKN